MAASAQNSNGPISDEDINDWKNRFNEVLAKPNDHVNSKSPEGSQPWTNSLFGCFNPIDLCLMTWCLPCVTFGKTHHRIRKDANLQGYDPINTSCLMFFGSACVGLHWIPMSMQRADIRNRYHLQGSCLVDIATACCCGVCDLVQQDKEATQRELLMHAGGDKQQSTPMMRRPYRVRRK
ncbi:PLAC8 family-domain-containing protein [Pseudomassariella vexata]|uniref:PLAC8 family-domain-containing protein n=1 Tax=Pseudomassariella vexata TaxID=1141098 RepID=A0A1Y2E4G6_9PEZI|nr:PLAC8 family-domain-containing protein [Pseudomassariella vexata]ORY66186.1 PLAC8 family-domain-containing protein [Pseudomassariella vexata]